MKLRLPQKVSYILDILQRHGFEAYAVGGCVRDMILARRPDDFDITTSARPEEVKACFRRTVDTGIRHGTVTVMLGSDSFEVTTYRIDGNYSDGRHPDSVSFTPDLKEDLLRRDFTINAMAYNDRNGLVDISGGMADLQKRVVRCVGNPDRRFDEDALRVMRAVRFAAQLGFSIEQKTREAVRRHSENLKAVSAERIRTELVKLLISSHPEMVEDLYRLDITKVILPEFDRLMETPMVRPGVPDGTAGEHTLRSLRYVEADTVLRLAALLHETGKPDVRVRDEFGWDHFPGYAGNSALTADAVLKRLRFDNLTRKRVTNLVRCHSLDPETDASSVRLCMYETGPDEFDSYLALRWADLAAGKTGSPDEEDPDLKNISNIYTRAQQIRRNQDPLSLKDLAVNGDDLAEMGIRGKETGTLLQSLLLAVLKNPGLNRRDRLLLLVTEIKAGREVSKNM